MISLQKGTNCIMSKSIIWKVSTSDRCSTGICIRASFLDFVISMPMIR